MFDLTLQFKSEGKIKSGEEESFHKGIKLILEGKIFRLTHDDFLSKITGFVSGLLAALGLAKAQ